ncbi:ATPase/DNA packaging protein [NY_014 poxvirus]|uniref:ATPase/DNA packaging protein n=1 Tax=NY_014 poxvirus TaxID=2025360 RepID=UPI000B9A07FE|nr:ATPase/DNA packaging protein [NY_014 poxvirus]AST09546.1 ATPase/DNA packaging protein [NY_014 poxvirus]
MNSFQEKRFSRETLLKMPFRMVLTGGSGSGKTIYLLSLFSTLVKKYKHIFLFTPVYNPDYDGYIWPDHINTVETPEALEYALRDTKIKITKYITKNSHKKAEHFLIIVDDMGEKLSKSGTIIDFLNFGRHLNTSLIMLCQTYRHVPVAGRSNITHFCSFNISLSDAENMLRSMPVKGKRKDILYMLNIIQNGKSNTRLAIIIEDSVFCEGELRICTDIADKDVIEQKLNPDILLKQFSHMKKNLNTILEANNTLINHSKSSSKSSSSSDE